MNCSKKFQILTQTLIVQWNPRASFYCLISCFFQFVFVLKDIFGSLKRQSDVLQNLKSDLSRVAEVIQNLKDELSSFKLRMPATDTVKRLNNCEKNYIA